MKTTLLTSLALASLSMSLVACGDDEPGDNNCSTADAPVCGNDDGGTPNAVYVQVEHLGRPGIAEALLLSNGFLAGYNATAPTFTGVPAATLNQVVGEAKTVLKAVYYGVCLTNGLANLTAATGLKPAGQTCAAVGGAIFTDGTGTALTQAIQDGATAYADLVFGQFIPDTLRIDTTLQSGYLVGAGGSLNLCAGLAPNAPLLCGGRLLTDDVIDITYNYLLAGAAISSTSPAQFQALVSDGVSYTGAANNPGQGHPPTAATFPYSAAPI